MPKVLIIYATDYGSTKKMAEAIAEGARSVGGTEVVLKAAEQITADDMTSSDALIFGSPVHMGSIDWRIKKLIDTVCGTLWMKDRLIGKVAGVFATGSGYGGAGGGAELTLLALMANLAELGLVLIPLPKNTPGYAKGGIHWGPYGRSADVDLKPAALPEEALISARHHGANIARAAVALSGKTIFAV